MATRVELTKDTVKNALTQHLQSLNRAMKATVNPAFKPIYEKDIADLQNAMNTITEIK